MELTTEELNNPIIDIELLIEDIRKLHDSDPEYDLLENIIDLYYDILNKYKNMLKKYIQLSDHLIELIINNKHHQTIKKYKRLISENNEMINYYEEQLTFIMSTISIIKSDCVDKLIEENTQLYKRIIYNFNNLSKDIDISEKMHNNYSNKIKSIEQELF